MTQFNLSGLKKILNPSSGKRNVVDQITDRLSKSSIGLSSGDDTLNAVSFSGMDAFDLTLTLSGIAGIILSIGRAVDANVIIFSRIREEIAAGKTVQSAIKIGFEKALSAIVDGNITTLIAALVLGLKGSGTVKGFAIHWGLVLSFPCSRHYL